MASTKDFRDFVLEQLNFDEIVCKPMMGEFLLYYSNKLFGGIYDNRFLIKKTNSNKKYSLCEEIPYKNAKPMYLVEDLEDKEYLEKLVKETCKEL